MTQEGCSIHKLTMGDSRATSDGFDDLVELMPDLVGEQVLDENGNLLKISDVSTKFAVAQYADEKKTHSRRLNRNIAIKGWFKHEMSLHTAKTGLPWRVKQILGDLARLSNELRESGRTLDAKLEQQSLLLEKLQGRMEKHKQQEAERGNQLRACRDNITGPSLQRQLNSATERVEVLKRERERLNETISGPFDGYTSIIAFFKTRFDIMVPKSTLSRYANEPVRSGSKAGPKPLLGRAGEEALAQTVIAMDKMGFPMSRHKILGVADRMCEGLPGRENKDGLTLGWYRGWFARMRTKFTELVEVSCRTSDNRCREWFNEENYKWWFQQLIDITMKNGFVEKVGEKYKWLCPERVMITDETCISGGELRKKQATRVKVVTTQDKAEGSSRGGGQRRVAAPEKYEEHITMMGGMTLDYELTPPWFVISSNAKKPKDSTLETVRRAYPKGDEFVKINGRKLEEPIIGWSSKGGVTRENIKDMAIKMIKFVWPDVADEPGKRVLWLTDMHGSRLCATLLDTLRRMGVLLVVWLPNCTSKMQAPDVSMFGPFKEARDKLEREWVAENPRKKVTREGMIRFASKALVKACHRTVLVKGARETGVRPLDREVLLNHPAIKDGDAARDAHSKVIGTNIKRSLQEVDPTMDPSDVAKATLKELEKSRPRMGQLRTLYDGGKSVTKDHCDTQLQDALNRLRDKIADDAELNAKVQRFKTTQEEKNDALDREIEKFQKQKVDVAAVTTDFRLKLTQEREHFIAWRDHLASLSSPLGDDARKLLATIQDKLYTLGYASLDEHGLPCVEPVQYDVLPTTPMADGVRLTPLKRLVQETSASCQERIVKKMKNSGGLKPVQYKFDGSGIMNASSSIELTSDEVFDIVVARTEAKQETVQRRAKKRALQHKKEVTKLVTMKDMMKKAASFVRSALQHGDPVAKLRVGSSRPLIELSIDYADVHNLPTVCADAKRVKAMKHRELKQGILDFYQRHVLGELSFLKEE